MPIYSAAIGDSADLVQAIVELYVPRDSEVLDATYGLGRFWKQVPDKDQRWNFTSNDVDPERGSNSYDCREFPEEWGNRFDAVFLDPPFKMNSGTTAGEPDQGYGVKERVSEGIHGARAVLGFYQEAMNEARRLLKSQGVLVVKAMDQIMGGKQQRQSIDVWMYATRELNMVDEDLFILVRKSKPPMRHKHQLHARKNHSVFWVFRR